jgi:methyltransferase
VTTAPLAWVLAAIVLSRLVEINIAEVNTGRLRAQDWREVGARRYPLFVALHVSLLIAIAVTTPLHRRPVWPLVWVLGALQILRLWIIASLGPYWTTRLLTRDDIPLRATGPYRLLRHPAYVVVTVEVAVLPLAFGDWIIALVWSALNALLLQHRIRLENAALAPRRALG